jgi:cell division protease FtsH
LSEHREKLDRLAEGLMEREELSEQEIIELIGPSVRHEASDLAPSGT